MSGSSWWRSDEIWQTDESSITPQRLSRFGIEVDEALRVGSFGFLGESDAGEVVCDSFKKNFNVDVQAIKWWEMTRAERSSKDQIETEHTHYVVEIPVQILSGEEWEELVEE